MDERQRDLERVSSSMGKTMIKNRCGGPYRLDSFDSETERVTLIPLHQGGRKTRKWFRHLFLDYRLADEESPS
ncbi:hypothetical protein [Pseudomonas putida]|uniref:hypothetical protein n=1 Tax=Pseudomonas putida TaxID=303 RepID=UPI0011CE7940|nr:hypothetical protein [Pseudomonas putida]